MAGKAGATRGKHAARPEPRTLPPPRHNVSDGSTSPFSVLNQGSLLDASESTTRTFTVLLAAVAAISLLVGGSGGMNILPVRRPDRARGGRIRHAIGPPQRAVPAPVLHAGGSP